MNETRFSQLSLASIEDLALEEKNRKIMISELFNDVMTVDQRNSTNLHRQQNSTSIQSKGFQLKNQLNHRQNQINYTVPSFMVSPSSRRTLETHQANLAAKEAR